MNDLFPWFADELRELLENAGRADLARKVEKLEVVDRCRCQDDFCSSFYTAPKPDGAYGPGHSNLALSPKQGMVILDLVDDEIRYVEVIDRRDFRGALLAQVP